MDKIAVTATHQKIIQELKESKDKKGYIMKSLATCFPYVAQEIAQLREKGAIFDWEEEFALYIVAISEQSYSFMVLQAGLRRTKKELERIRQEKLL